MFNVMYSRYILTISAFVVVLMMDVLYFAKAKISSKLQHKMYSYLIVVNTLILISEFTIMFAFGVDTSFDICVILLKIRDVLLMAYFVFVLFYYFTAISDVQYKDVSDFFKSERLVTIQGIFFAVTVIVHLFLPYNFMTKETYNAAFGGPAFYLTIAYCVITTLEILFVMIFRRKDKVNLSEKLSLLWLFIVMIMILVFQVIFYEVTVMGILSSVYILVLYFILENPDLELISEIDTLAVETERANSTKLDFLSNISEEMVSPINNIVILSESVLSDKNVDTVKLRKEIKQIELSSKSFLEIVNNTLNISNIEGEKDALFEKNYSLAQLLTRLNNVIKERMMGKNLQLVMNIDKTIPSNLYGDANKIYQILLNIISNSVKYTEVGKVSVSLNQEVKASKIMLRFKISDTGYGIKKEDYDKIFQKYSRLDEAVSNGIEGTGLGLAISKKYVDLLGGKIWFDSVYGAGTNFYLEIPQQIVNMNDTLESFKDEDATSEEEMTILDCSNHKILIVEDNPLNLDVMVRIFKLYKFDVDTCTSGKDCIFKYKKGEQYDMIFIDHKMPEMSGVEVMKIIRKLKDYQAPPLIALTANAFTDSRDVYLKEGFDDYLPKPIDMVELNTLVNKYFKK